MHSILKYYLIFSTSFLAATAIGDFYNYSSQVCCNGKISPILRSSVLSTAGVFLNNYQCCGGQYVQINKTQICCNNVVVSVPSKYTSPSCCGSQVYDYSTSQCCNATVKSKIGGAYSGCCGSNPYNYSTQICCYQTGKVLNKSASNCPSSVYYSCCNDRLIGPNQQCCNGVVINPSTTLVSYSYGNYSSTSYCCASGGIVQDPNKETCCDKGGVMPSAGPGSACCNGQIYNSSSQICCGTTIFPNANYAVGCCGNNVYDYSSQTCCNAKIIDNTGGNSGCCGDLAYNYNTQQCCNNVIYNQNQTSGLNCCYKPVVYNQK